MPVHTPVSQHIARAVTKVTMAVLRRWGWICAGILLACLSIFLLVVWLVGSMAGATWSPVACSTLEVKDVRSPSRQWLAFTNIQSCDEPSPSYEIRLGLAPTPDFLKAHPESKSEYIFYLNLSAHPSRSNTVKMTWKNDQNLEIFAPGCENVCVASTENLQGCRSSYYSMVPSHEGINITLTRQDPDK